MMMFACNCDASYFYGSSEKRLCKLPELNIFHCEDIIHKMIGHIFLKASSPKQRNTEKLMYTNNDIIGDILHEEVYT